MVVRQVFIFEDLMIQWSSPEQSQETQSLRHRTVILSGAVDLREVSKGLGMEATGREDIHRPEGWAQVI
jgi:hypothetical protein